MNVLLDTHTFLWAVTGDQRLSRTAKAVIVDIRNRLLLSAASMWEIVLKAETGKLILAGGAEQFLMEELARNAIRTLPVESQHVLRVSRLPRHHRDPFDRILIAQAQAEDLPIITRDPEISRYGVQVIW